MSFGEITTEEEVDYFIDSLEEIINKLRNMSPCMRIYKGRWSIMYSEKVMDHFMNPRNVGEIENADGVGQVGNAKCGDIMKMYLKIEDGIIMDAKFKTFGCGAAVATSSMATELIKGKRQ